MGLGAFSTPFYRTPFSGDARQMCDVCYHPYKTHTDGGACSRPHCLCLEYKAGALPDGMRSSGHLCPLCFHEERLHVCKTCGNRRFDHERGIAACVYSGLPGHAACHVFAKGGCPSDEDAGFADVCAICLHVRHGTFCAYYCDCKTFVRLHVGGPVSDTAAPPEPDCKETSAKLVALDSGLVVVRGYVVFTDPEDGHGFTEHWWCKAARKGTDETVDPCMGHLKVEYMPLRERGDVLQSICDAFDGPCQQTPTCEWCEGRFGLETRGLSRRRLVRPPRVIVDKLMAENARLRRMLGLVVP